MTIQAVILGPPRTKKNSATIVHIPGKRGEDFHKCEKCGQEVGRGRGFNKLLPSDSFQEWLKEACLQGPKIRFDLQKAGVKLPISVPVSVKMLIYRQRDTGDIFGFYDAVADGLQAPMYAFPCAACKKKTLSADHRGVKCSECGVQLHLGKQSREGMGIILDDSQIKSTDGSRLLIDKVNPRVEIEISDFLEVPVQAEGLFDALPDPVSPPAPEVTDPFGAALKKQPFVRPKTGLLGPDE